ncbi:hypothetical protein BU24DRAFT_487461 [Aaosphaeria arxii CBS 175.79]|uniref:Uncharacterized protein n=1 Tax=Aaosphaeria arxii CBS 175.79 TaxID=1450172 RepID=A0A6A5Y7G9_9PLEO|nr:uncharacterized protein BU24DRAFT_487461 [Aaosphaeria arxii CBS 175.79]KAF2020947.1 hypothetical protein BU24DRAFT_487461 [Aaosphaeria arxii CBS 175.79]
MKETSLEETTSIARKDTPTNGNEPSTARQNDAKRAGPPTSEPAFLTGSAPQPPPPALMPDAVRLVTRNATPLDCSNVEQSPLSIYRAAAGLTPTPAGPNYTELQSILRDLIVLARQCFNRHECSITLHMRSLRLHGRTKRFFDRWVGHDFLGDGMYGYCLETQQLFNIIEIVARNDPSFHFGPIAWPQPNIGSDDYCALKSAVCMEIDSLIFKRSDLNLAELAI